MNAGGVGPLCQGVRVRSKGQKQPAPNPFTLRSTRARKPVEAPWNSNGMQYEMPRANLGPPTGMPLILRAPNQPAYEQFPAPEQHDPNLRCCPEMPFWNMVLGACLAGPPKGRSKVDTSYLLPAIFRKTAQKRDFWELEMEGEDRPMASGRRFRDNFLELSLQEAPMLPPSGRGWQGFPGPPGECFLRIHWPEGRDCLLRHIQVGIQAQPALEFGAAAVLPKEYFSHPVMPALDAALGLPEHTERHVD
jgi:hypothetical protein